MTGPEHYIEAKRLLLTAEDLTNDLTFKRNPGQMLAHAQVHASLAAAAASAELAAELFKSRESGWWRRRQLRAVARSWERSWGRSRRSSALYENVESRSLRSDNPVTAAVKRPRSAWSHRVRELTREEYSADPRNCRVEGCDEPGRFERSWFYRTSTGKVWKRRDHVCAVGADEFAHQFQLVIEPAPPKGVGR